MSQIFIVKFTSVYGSISTRLFTEFNLAHKFMAGLDAAGCTDIDFDQRSISDEDEAFNDLMAIMWADGVTKDEIVKAWEGQEE